HRQVIAVQDATITAFCALAEERDTDTGRHIHRTQRYVRVLAEELRDHPRFRSALDDATIELLFKSAPLHDIGKVAIPDAILLKPGKLTAAEWEIMKRHAEYGRLAIAQASAELKDGDDRFLRHAADIAQGHHERWDGSGYPGGLAGDAIPLSARLMAVADVYDALVSRRVYKDPIPHERALAMIAAERGRHFDPDMTDAAAAIADRFAAIAAEFSDPARS
ncbi:MAG TPA: HD domain-containing phosphohydrolase, partial [Rhodocyclaceae bacterium]|nr:HD domain-containing phosphohydrolase [Rhodocyclaceae bacterium]